MIESASFSICAYLASALVSDLDAYAIGFHSPLSCFSQITAPRPYADASDDSAVGLVGEYKAKTGG